MHSKTLVILVLSMLCYTSFAVLHYSVTCSAMGSTIYVDDNYNASTPGWGFDHWSGNLTGSNNPEYIFMDGNKTVTATFIQLFPDLSCDGSLSWTCSPGETVTGSFTVENIGDPE